MSHCGQRTTWPQAGHWMCVEKPRRFNSSITCPPSSSAALMAVCSCRLMAPLESDRGPSRRGGRSCPPPASAGRARGAASRPARTGRSGHDASSPATAWPSPRPAGSLPPRPGRWPRRGHDTAGRISCLNDVSCSSSSTIMSQVRRGGEDRAAGADDHRDGPLGDPLPVPVPLGVAQVAVQHGHRAEPLAEPLDRLRREADLRHQHDRLPAEMDHLLDRLDVDLGLAAAGHAVDEDRLVPAERSGRRGSSAGPFPGRDSSTQVLFAGDRRFVAAAAWRSARCASGSGPCAEER